MGNGTKEQITETADVIGTISVKNEVKRVRIQDVTILKNGRFNLFSLSQMLKKGWKLTGNDEYIAISKGDLEIRFDQRIPTKNGVLYGVRIARDDEFCGGIQDTGTVKMTLSEAHGKLGHMSFQKTKQIAKQLGWILTGSNEMCEACAEGKARQKNIIVKTSKRSDSMQNGRIHLDISSVKNNDYDDPTSKPYWRIIVDERTQIKFSDFFASKNGMVEPTCQLVQNLKNSGKDIRIIRCDDGGENKALENRMNSSDWKMGIKFEYTGRDTPQRNSLAEVAFHTIASRGRAMLNAANVPRKFRFMLWREAFKTATLLDGMSIIKIDDKIDTRYAHWDGQIPKCLTQLRTWGEAGTVKLRTRSHTKLDDRGYTCMFVGYSTTHAGDTYRMWDPRSRRVHLTRDIRWLNKMFFDRNENVRMNYTEGIRRISENLEDKSVKSDDDQNNNDDSDESVEDLVSELLDDAADNSTEKGDENIDKGGEQTTTTRYGRSVRPPTRYDEFVKIGVDNDETRDEYAFIMSTEELHVMKYNEAMQSRDKKEWIKAVQEEHERMVKSGVWTAVDKNTLKTTDKVLTTTWAMKKKPNGSYRARINARGFEQLDGLHYDSSSTSSPVTNDTTIRVIFTLAMLAGWKGYVIDVKGAFLNGRFDKGEELFLKIPQGFEEFYKESQVLKLNRTIYGLKQAAQAFWTELLRALTAMGFTRSDGDPCCYYKNVSGRKIVCLSWVDDCIFFGSISDIIREKNKMMEYFECEDVGFVKEYVGCKVKMNEKEKSVKFTQPILVKSLVDEFGAGFKHVSTPAPAGQCLQAGNDEDIVREKEKKKYQAGVGKLLYLTRWSRPEIGNSVRELSKFATKPQISHQLAMERAMNFCVSYEDIGWTLKPTGIWNENEENEVNIVGISDSDYSKDIETRRSVTGYIVFLNGAPVAAKSKMQEAVTLSVTEAELVAATHCYQEMLYVKKVLESIKISVKLPMVLKMDNKGAKDLINNWSVGGRTRHIDVRYLFLREAKEKNMVKIEWISSQNNPSDLFTKNLSIDLFKKHSSVFSGNLV